MGLTNKQEIFCQEYVKCDNKSQAYRIAYETSGMTDKTINEASSKLSKDYNVATRISELKAIAKEVAEKHFKIDSKELLGHLNILRQSRIDEYVDFVEFEEQYESPFQEGKIETRVVRKLQFKPFDQLTEKQLMCIESIKDTRNNGIELKLHGKDWTIDKIAKHIGFYEKDHSQSRIPQRIIIDKSDYNKKKD